jgi:catechol 2,3-dioxygenase-like lactoylglutathione lyase family enzyme
MAEARPGWEEETVPVIRVMDVRVAISWYSRLGFLAEWEHRFEPEFPAFASIRRGPEGAGVRLFLSEHKGDALPGGLVYIRVADVRPIAEEFDSAIVDLDGRLEVHLEDPDTNRIRVGSRLGNPPSRGYSYPTTDVAQAPS